MGYSILAVVVVAHSSELQVTDVSFYTIPSLIIMSTGVVQFVDAGEICHHVCQDEILASRDMTRYSRIQVTAQGQLPGLVRNGMVHLLSANVQNVPPVAPSERGKAWCP